MQKLMLYIALCVCAWGLTQACGPDGTCTEASQCPSGHICVNNTCQAATEPTDASVTEPKQESVPETKTTETVVETTTKPEPTKEAVPEVPTKCTPGNSRLCYSGAPDTRGVGQCVQGKQTCLVTRKWTACVGERLPKEEACNGKDDDCDGKSDEEAKCEDCADCKSGACVVRDDATPTLTKIAPESSTPLNPLTFEITGSCFAEKAVVEFDGKPVKTTYVSKTLLEASVDLTQYKPGKYDITVKGPGGKVSKAMTFELLVPPCTNPRPSLSGFTPTDAEGGKMISFKVNGFNFNAKSEIYFDSKPIKTKLVSSSQLEADPSLDLTAIKSGAFDVWVDNNDGCVSSKRTFNVYDPNATPTITTISPNTINIGKSNTLTITGTGFLPGGTFSIGLNTIIGLQFVNTTQLRITFTPASTTWSPGTQKAFVSNTNGKQSNLVQVTFK